MSGNASHLQAAALYIWIRERVFHFRETVAYRDKSKTRASDDFRCSEASRSS